MAWVSPRCKALSCLHLSVFSRGLKKSSQELYGLICYGELRKKVGGCEYGVLAALGVTLLCPCGPSRQGLLSCHHRICDARAVFLRLKS